MKKKYRNTKISKHVLYIRGAHKEREKDTHRIYAIMQHMHSYTNRPISVYLVWKLKTQNSKAATATSTANIHARNRSSKTHRKKMILYLKLSSMPTFISIYQNNKHSLWALGLLQFSPFRYSLNGRCYFCFSFCLPLLLLLLLLLLQYTFSWVFL